MFNYLFLYNKRYIVVVIVGVVLVNIVFFFGLIDVVVGSVSMLIVLFINYKIISCIKNMKIKMVVIVCVFVFFMFIVVG